MVVQNTGLTKEELDFLVERLSRENDDSPLLDADLESLTQREIQADLKTRLQRGIDDLRANNEDVPTELLRLLERM